MRASATGWKPIPTRPKTCGGQNKSYVFFRITDLATEDEAVGAEGVPLVPGTFDRDRSRAACLRHAVLHRRRFADRQREGGDEIPPAGVRAGYRLGHRRPGARRYLFRRRRRGRAHGRPHQESWRLHDAYSARSSIRSRQGATCRCLRNVRAASVSASPPWTIRPTCRTGADSRAAHAGSEAAPRRPASPAPKPKRAAKAMSRRRQLSDEERALWKTLRARSSRCEIRAKSAERRRTKSPVTLPAKPRGATRAAAPRHAAAGRKPPPLVPLDRRLKQRVARGREPIEARLDLHGMTQMQAHGELLRFLQRSSVRRRQDRARRHR